MAALLKTEYTDISLVVVSADARIEAGADYTFYYYDVCGRELSYAQLDGYDEVYPIDEDLLKKMDVYLPEILKMMDRLNIVSFERRWRLYIDILEYWNSYLDKQNIVYYIHFNVPHEVTDYIIYSLCKVKGINYVGYSYFFYGVKCCYLHDDLYNQYTQIKVKYDELGDNDVSLQGNVLDLYNRVLGVYGDEEPPYMLEQRKQDCFYKENSFCKMVFSRVRKAASVIKKSFLRDDRACNYYRNAIEDSSFMREPYLLRKYYESLCSKVDYSKKYIYIPLNYQPEATTSPNGGYYVDMILIISMLNRLIPAGVKLLVKEHPSTWMFSTKSYLCSRSDLYYKSLRKMKNVQLVSSEESSFQLMKNAIAVAVCTGTAGFESIFRFKPCLCFGNIYFQYAPGVINIRTVEDCRRAIEQIMADEVKISDKDLKRYLYAALSVGIKATNNLELYADAQECLIGMERLANAYFDYIKQRFRSFEKII